MLVDHIKCLLNRHQPDRMRVAARKPYLVGRCTVCGTRIYRKHHRDWRRITERQDARLAHGSQTGNIADQPISEA